METAKVRIVLADDQVLFREGLRRLLESERGFLVLGEATDGVEGLRLAHQLKPDILLLDWKMPRMPGLKVLRELAASSSSTRVIVLTSAIERSDVQKAIEHGARGVVLKESGSTVLFRAIRGVMAGQYWFGRESLGDLVQILRALTAPGPTPKAKRDFGLTAREFDIVSAVAAAYCNKEIAQTFSISEKTVKHHLSNIFDKIGVSNRLELALFAVNHGMELADMTAVSEPH